MVDKQKISILIIEVNPADQILLQENLKSTGLLLDDIVMAGSLAEGLSILNNKKFSLLFFGLLPGFEGLESVTELTRLHARLPIVIYSGVADTHVALQAITLGAQDVLIKGDYTNSLLEKTVRYSIERKHNLDALQESIERYNMVSMATHDMVWDWDLTTDEVFRNANGWQKIFKTTEVKEIGNNQDWPARVYPEDRKRVKGQIEAAIASATQQLFEFEFRVLRDDDTVGYIADRGYIIRNAEGKAVRIIGASQDITARKNAENKVALSEQRFKSLVQNSADLLAILDGDGHYIYVSPTSKIILGFEPDYFIGKSPFAFIHEDDLKKTLVTFAEVSSQKFVEAPLFRFKNAAGEWRWIESVISNRLDDPAINGIVVNSRDVTERKIANDEIEKLSLVAKETVNGIIISDNDQNVVWVNNAFTKMFGYELEEVIGKNPSDFLPGPDTDKEVIAFVRKQKKGFKAPFSFEFLAYGKTEIPKYLSVLIQPIFDESGNVKQSFALQTDITEKRRLEAAVENEKLIKQKQITDAVFSAQEKERSEIGRELHDNVNQLLGATRLYIDMARRNEETREEMLTSASGFTLDAIEEIRKLSKTLITPLIQEMGLVDAIKESIDEIMLVHPIQIVFTANEFHEKEFDDKFKLNIFRIMQEQINNVLKHAQASTLSVTIETDKDKLVLCLTDNGTGFDTSERKTGVGLTNIKSRCELFNGIMRLTSEPGKGTSLMLIFSDNQLIRNLP